MSDAPTNRRAAGRQALDAEVLLVTAGEDGPVVRTGRSLEVSAGGCTLRLDEPLDGPAPNGVLIVRTPGTDGDGSNGGTELRMLSGPVRAEPGEPRVVGLRFVPPTEHDGSWSELVESLASGR